VRSPYSARSSRANLNSSSSRSSSRRGLGLHADDAVPAALAIGETGAEGKVIGLVFRAGAGKPLRGWQRLPAGYRSFPEYAPLLHWAPVACWSVAGAGLLVIAASRAQRSFQMRRI